MDLVGKTLLAVIALSLITLNLQVNHLSENQERTRKGLRAIEASVNFIGMDVGNLSEPEPYSGPTSVNIVGIGGHSFSQGDIRQFGPALPVRVKNWP